MKQGYCTLLAVPMRQTPSDRVEMVNQLLRGDTFDILEEQSSWSFIRCHYDGYEGWVDNKQILPLTNSSYKIGAVINPFQDSPSIVARQYYLGTPYLWGGRTQTGIDCSGLTQVCFKACGVRLLRDVSQQFTQGIPIMGLTEAQCDDLCFFHNAMGKIIHVGIYLGNGRIIHASGEVRIDYLTSEGIIHSEKHQLTHSLHSIRRVK